MAWPKSLAGAAGTDIASAGIGATKVSGDTGAFKLSGFDRAYRSVASQAVGYKFSDTLTSKNYKAKISLFTSSLTINERIGVTGRDTTSSSSARNMVWARVRYVANTNLYVELYKCVNNVFTQQGSSVDVLAAPYNVAADTAYDLELECNEDQFTVRWGGVAVIGPLTISDSVLQSIGSIGLYSSGDSTAATAGTTSTNGTGIHISSFDMSYLSSDVTASGAPPAITVTAPTGTASASGSDVTASGAPPSVTVTAPTGVATAGNPLALAEFFGSNVDVANSTITNAGTSTPTVNLAIRNPEGGTPIWQHFRAALVNDSGIDKTVLVNVDLANEESQSGTVRSTWPGPYRANTLNDINAWTAIARSATGGILSFTLVVAAGETVYICSMPPGIRPQVEDWLADLVAAYPSFIHDDLPSRVALGSTAYKCDTAPTVVDELGRTISGEPMLGFRIGNDSVGTPSTKREICLFSMLHPGEDHGFIQLRGCIDKWLSDASFATVRNTFNLVVRPIGAPNGTKGGYRRYEPRVGLASGDNLNREWKPSSLNQTAQKWQALLDTDHGVGFDRVEALIDFHDLSASSQVAFYYYRAESPNIASLQAVVESAIPGINSVSSTNDSTTTDYFVNTKGVGPAMTAEVSDQSASLAGFLAVGAGWASVLKGWFEAGLIGPVDVTAGGSAPAITVSAPTGQAQVSGNASGAPAGITVSAPTGNAYEGGMPANASGAPTGISVTAPTGNAEGNIVYASARFTGRSHGVAPKENKRPADSEPKRHA